jgi:hypothetical protein
MLKLKQPDPDEVVENANDLNAPLAPDSPASDNPGFRPLTAEQKKDFMDSLDAKGRQILADLESPPNLFEHDRRFAVPRSKSNIT